MFLFLLIILVRLVLIKIDKVWVEYLICGKGEVVVWLVDLEDDFDGRWGER